MNKLDLAPILILTLNRYDHFKNCVKSLSKCQHAEESVLCIALDYPLNKSHWQGYYKICEYLPKIRGFKDVIVIKRTTNYGPNMNFQYAADFLFEKYEHIIFSEDDNVFSPDFLNFVNRGLVIYQDRVDVFSISGYQYPINISHDYDHDVYLWQGYSAWGVGIWRDKWKKVPWQKDESIIIIQRFLKMYKSVYNYHKIANHYIPGLILMLEQNIFNGDGMVCLHQFLNNMYSVFPVVSRVRNMGHDGSGTGCSYLEKDIYAKQEIYSSGVGKCIMPPEIQTNMEINKILADHFRTHFKSKIKTIVKMVLLSAGLWR